MGNLSEHAGCTEGGVLHCGSESVQAGQVRTRHWSEVVAPEFLKQFRPDNDVVLNPIYKNEIAAMINKMSIEVRLTVE